MGETQYQVIRAEKLHSGARVFYRLSHAMREHIPEHAKKELQAENRYFLPGIKDAGKMTPEERLSKAMAQWRSNLPEKYRKDATTCVEYVVSGSHDRMHQLSRADQEKYMKASVHWITEKMGGPQNVIAVSFHFDEVTPHASIFVTPKVNGRLNAKGLLGNKKDLADMQTYFNLDVAKGFGFERGTPYSMAKHTSTHEYHALGAIITDYTQELTKFMRQKARVDGLYERVQKPSSSLDDRKAYDEAKKLLWAQERSLEKAREKMTPEDWSLVDLAKKSAREDVSKGR